MSDPKTTVKNQYLICILIAAGVFILNLLHILLNYLAVYQTDDFGIRGVMVAAFFLLFYFYIRFFPFSVIESKYGILNAGLLIAVTLIGFLFRQGALSNLIVSIVLLIIFGVFSVLFHKKTGVVLQAQGVNDYVFLELKTYKIFELNILSLVLFHLFQLLLFFGQATVALYVVCAIGVAIAIYGNYRRYFKDTRYQRDWVLFALETICLIVAYAVLVVYRLHGGYWIFMGLLAVILAIPNLALTIKIHRELKNYMYK